MALNRLSLSGNIKAKEMNYSDNFFKLKSERVITSDSFPYNIYNALTDVNDFKTNNYSNLILSRKMKNSDWLEADIKKNVKQLDIITTISFYGNNPEDEIEKGSWLYFDKNYEMWDINLENVNYLITYGRPTKNYYNYIFHIDFVDDNTCKILHTFGDIIFYLSVDELLNVSFSKFDNESNLFQYSLDGDRMILYKKVKHVTRDETDEIIDEKYKLYTLNIERLDENSAKLVLSENLNQTNSNLIYIVNNVLDMDFYLDASWTSYDRSQYIDSINRSKSAFNLETQALFHHQYNNEDTINFVPLKNNLTYKGNTIRGNNLTISDSFYPDVDFRNYTNINSGLNQEKGNDNIILNFLFNDQEYEVNEGEDLHITIPEISSNGHIDIHPLWPYNYININDTKFTKNGAFGSSSPAFADKFKKYQGHTTHVYDENGNRVTPNNGTYLCTWLYKENHEAEPIWMDRYYYPDLTQKYQIIDKLANVYDENNEQPFKNTFDKSFDNIIDTHYLTDEETGEKTKKKILQNVYFDKVSDVLIEPGCSYIYSRLSKEMVEEKNEQISSNLISEVKTKVNKDINLYDYFVFDNENFIKIPHKLWNKTNAINFNTDIYLDSKKKIGIQLFGADYTDGFNIQNRKDVSPFHYYATDETIYITNNKFEIVHQFSLFEKYGDYIVKFFMGDVFDDIIVLSGMHLYIFAYDLRLKSRLSLVGTPTQQVIGKDEEGNDIVKMVDVESVYNLSKLKLYAGDDVISLKNYPYGNNGKLLTKKINNSGTITSEKGFGSKNIKPSISNTERFITLPYANKYKIMPSSIVNMISDSNAISYKNNLYIPFGQDILKIILCPDSDKDFELFTEEIRENYPAAARVLLPSEYHLNYIRKSNTNSEEISLQSGFINVENKIKNIFIDENGIIYGFNYDKIAIVPDGDTVYGLYAGQDYINSGGWYWVFNQSLSKMIASSDTSKYGEFASQNSIDMIKFNNRGEMALIRNFNNHQDNQNSDNNKRLDIYDKSKKRIYTYDLGAYEEIISLDSYVYITDAHEERCVFTLLAKAAASIYQISYISDTKEMIAKMTNLSYNHNKKFYETINSNAIMRYKDSNALYFNLHIPSPYIYDYIATIKWNLEDLQAGWYNINVKVDLDNAIFEVRINDEIYETINEDTHNWFKPYANSNGTIFDSTYYIGCVGKKYGTTLNKIINNAPYDPYVCKNSKIENTTIYTKSLAYDEYQAMRLRNKNINKLILTLPCGTRNSIDEIVRYFKYNAAGSVSNKVKINISGTGLETQGEFDMLRREILSTLELQKDCLIDVKEIEFI